MKQLNVKKLVLLNLPYILLGLFATNLGEAWRLAAGADGGPACTRWTWPWGFAAARRCGWRCT